jgi:tagatose-1,6-bisphosphate aldolase
LTCPARPARVNAAVWLALAIVVTAGGVSAQVFARANQAMLNAAAAGILAGVALLAAAVIMVIRSR